MERQRRAFERRRCLVGLERFVRTGMVCSESCRVHGALGGEGRHSVSLERRVELDLDLDLECIALLEPLARSPKPAEDVPSRAQPARRLMSRTDWTAG